MATIRHQYLTEDATSVLEQVGRQIRAARRARRWSAQELSERANTSRAALQRLEAGYGGTTLTTLVCVLDALGLTPTMQAIAAPGSDAVGQTLIAAGRGHTESMISEAEDF